MKPNLAFAVAAAAAERALSVDPALGAAWIEVALAKFGGEWDWDGAEAAFRRGLALDAANPLAHVHYSWLLVLLGRDDAAYAEARRGHDLAPASRLVAGARAQTMYIGGRYDEASHCAECLRVDPTYVFALHLRGLCHLATSARDGAVADLERAAVGGRRFTRLTGRCYGEFGMRREALDLTAELERQSPDTYVRWATCSLRRSWRARAALDIRRKHGTVRHRSTTWRRVFGTSTRCRRITSAASNRCG